tara:strand:+ start:158 stop:625 length:468 start_codon:yes stop_codon:yes gene_type:complete
MKRLLLPLLASLALPTAVEANWFGKYNSRYDANEACEIWMMKGFKYTYKVMGEKGTSSLPPFNGEKYTLAKDLDGKWFKYISTEYLEYRLKEDMEKKSLVEKTKSGFSRSCLEEKETNQFIGREKSCLKKKDYSLAEWKKLFELKSCEKRKYFKY